MARGTSSSHRLRRRPSTLRAQGLILPTGRPQLQLLYEGRGHGKSSEIDRCHLSADGAAVAISGAGGLAYIDLEAGESSHWLFTEGVMPRAFADCSFGPTQAGGRLLAGVSGDTLHLCDSSKGYRIAELTTSGGLTDCAFHPQGRLLATVARDGAVRLWDSEKRSELICRIGDDELNYCSFSPGGGYLAVAYTDGPVTLFTVTNDDDLIGEKNFDEHQDVVTSFAFSSSDGTLTTLDCNGEAVTRAISDGRPLSASAMHQHDDLADSTLSSDGSLAAVADYGGNVTLWRTSDGKKLLELDNLGGETRVSFAACSPRLVAVSPTQLKSWQLG